RLSFLPDLFGNDFLAGEMQVYALAEKHITDYCGQTMLNVEESDRLSFLPDLFGNDFLAGEMQVYALAEKHITDYCG
ncbi:hypothetical protein CP987_19855, partial [Morganella morganii]